MKNSILISLGLILLLNSCIQKDYHQMRVGTISADSITVNSANLKGVIVDLGDGMSDHGIFISKSEGAEKGTQISLGLPTGEDVYTVKANDLAIGTEYFYKAFGTNENEIVYGQEKSFITLDGLSSGIVTIDVTEITPISAICGGLIGTNNGFEITNKGVCWSTNPNPTIDDNFTDEGKGIDNFVSEITDLSVDMTYYVRAYATNQNGIAYGGDQVFKTLNGLPLNVTIQAASNVTAVSAVIKGNVNEDSGFNIIRKGVCWSTNSNPTIEDNFTVEGDGIGSFTSEIKGLNVSTTYFIRTYATNQNGTTYSSEQININTLDGKPSGLSTVDIYNITSTAAFSGGDVLNDGGFNITAKGVCWSRNLNPTLDDFFTNDGVGTGSFNSHIEDLTPKAVYHICSYATNENGTSYGNIIEFKTPYTDLYDYDENLYSAVKIGTQVWMAEDLKVTHYPDGVEIPNISENTNWTNLGDNNTDDAYCYYGNDINGNYGVLYTYAAAIKACPVGWHLPTDNEWKVLEMYLGMSINEVDQIGWRGTLEGRTLKAKVAWGNPGSGNDSYGFKALPNGRRWYDNGWFSSAGDAVYWWCNSEDDSNSAFFRSLYYHEGGIYRKSTNKSFGFSVRCIKDN